MPRYGALFELLGRFAISENGPAAGNSSHGKARGTSARAGHEIREWKNRPRAILLGPSFPAGAGGAAGSSNPAGRGCRAGQTATARRWEKRGQTHGIGI